MIKVDEDTVATGSSDGLIRLIQIQPDKLLTVLGDHDEFPVECIQFSRDRRLLGSCSHDNTVKFWDVGFLADDAEDEDEDEDGEEGDGGGASMADDDARAGRGAPKSRAGPPPSRAEDFFSDL